MKTYDEYDGADWAAAHELRHVETRERKRALRAMRLRKQEKGVRK